MKYRFDEIAVNSTEKKKPVEEDKNHYLGLEHLDPRQLKVARYGSETAPVGEKLIMKKGDVLFGKRRAYQKKVAIAPFDGIFSAHGMVLRPNEKIISKELFPFFISSDYFLDNAIRISVGSLSPTINWRDLKRLEFYLPHKDEQGKLADLLWAAEENIEAYNNLILATEKLIGAKFVEMFGNLGSNPFNYKWLSLKKCCEINPKKSKEAWLDNERDTEFSFVEMSSVTEKGLVDTSVVKPYREVEKGFTYFGENDVLFAKITPSMENGKGGIATNLKNGIGFGSTEFHVLRPIDGVSSPYWIYYLTSLKEFRVEAERSMTGTAGQRRVPASFLKNYMVGLPPIKHQIGFAEFARQAEKTIKKASSAMKALETMKKSIIKKYFG